MGLKMARFSNGFFKVWRPLVFGELASRNFETMWVMVRLLGMASIASGQQKIQHKGEFIELRPGQVLTSLDELSFGGKLDMQKIRRALHHLEKRQTICQSSDNKGRLITICNWEKYQYRSTSDDKQDASETQSNDNQMTIKRQHIEEIKNIRSKEQEEISGSDFKKYPQGMNPTQAYDLRMRMGPSFEAFFNKEGLVTLKRYIPEIVDTYKTLENLTYHLNSVRNSDEAKNLSENKSALNGLLASVVVATVKRTIEAKSLYLPPNNTPLKSNGES